MTEQEIVQALDEIGAAAGGGIPAILTGQRDLLEKK
jgi:hypothetical protein